MLFLQDIFWDFLFRRVNDNDFFKEGGDPSVIVWFLSETYDIKDIWVKKMIIGKTK